MDEQNFEPTPIEIDHLMTVVQRATFMQWDGPILIKELCNYSSFLTARNMFAKFLFENNEM